MPREKVQGNALVSACRGLGKTFPPCLLPRPPELSRSRFLSFQPQFLWDVLRGQDTHHLMTLIPLSLLGGPVRPSGQPFVHKPRASAELAAGPGSDPAAAGTLLVRGQSIPYHKQHKVRQSLWAQDMGWLRGQAAGAAAVPQPCTEPDGLQVRGQRLPGARNKAEGCEYAFTFLWL